MLVKELRHVPGTLATNRDQPRRGANPGRLGGSRNSAAVHMGVQVAGRHVRQVPLADTSTGPTLFCLPHRHLPFGSGTAMAA